MPPTCRRRASLARQSAGGGCRPSGAGARHIAAAPKRRSGARRRPRAPGTAAPRPALRRQHGRGAPAAVAVDASPRPAPAAPAEPAPRASRRRASSMSSRWPMRRAISSCAPILRATFISCISSRAASSSGRRPQAPANLANRLGARLTEWTGRRWVVSVSGEPGAPSLEQQAQAVIDAEREAAAAPSAGAGGAGRLSRQRRRGGARSAAAGGAGTPRGESEAGEQEPAAEQD